jgi:hypothetical protein
MSGIGVGSLPRQPIRCPNCEYIGERTYHSEEDHPWGLCPICKTPLVRRQMRSYVKRGDK